MSPSIPINPSDLPTEWLEWDDSLTYEGMIVNQGKGVDKNDTDYISITVEVDSPEEYQGLTVKDNYIPLMEIPEGGNAARRRRAMNSLVQLGQLCRATGWTEPFDIGDPPDLVGRHLKFMIKNEMYQDRLLPKIAKYLF